MDKEDLILEGLKNSLEAGAGAVDIFIDGNSFSISDDGHLGLIPDFKSGCSSKGGNRGRGLYLLYRETEGNLKLFRKDGRTVLEAAFPSPIKAEEIIPVCFNLTSDLTFHSLKDGKERYFINKDVLARMDLDLSRAKDISKLKKIIREKELRS